MKMLERRFSVLACIGLLVPMMGCSQDAGYYIQAGNALYEKEQYDDAAIEYRKAIQREPNLGEAYYRLGLTEIKRKNYLDSYRSLAKASELMPEDAEVKVKSADVALTLCLTQPAFSQAMYQQASKLADEMLAKDTNSFDGLRIKGALAMLDRKPAEAVELLEKANEIQPMYPDVVVTLAQALMQTGKGSEGERLALQMLEKDPASPAIHDVLYLYYAGQKQMADAERILKSKVKNNPGESEYVVQLAEHYERASNPSAMLEALQQLAGDSEQYRQGHLSIGEFYARRRNWTEASRHFEEGMRKHPADRPLYQLRMAQVHAAQGNRPQAMTLLDEMLKGQDEKKDQHYLDARRLRADLLLSSQQPENIDKALEEYTFLSAAQPADAVLRMNLGRALIAKRNWEDAARELQEAIRLGAPPVDTRILLAGVRLQQANARDALRLADEALAIQPESDAARLMRVTSLIPLGEYLQARRELTLLERKHPNVREVQLQKAQLALAEKDYATAERIYRSLGTSDPRAASGLTEVYVGRDQLDEAVVSLQREVSSGRATPQLRAMLASVALRAEKYDLAIGEYEGLLKNAPQSAELHLALGDAHQKKGDLTAAIGHFEKAVALAPANPTANLLLASALQRTGRNREAEASYRTVLKTQPDNPLAMNNLAFMLAESGGDLDEALRLAQKAVQTAPKASQLQDTLGWVYLQRGQTSSALQIFNALVQANPENATYRYHLGAALVKSGETARAKTELETALKSQPNPEQEKKIRELLGGIG